MNKDKKSRFIGTPKDFIIQKNESLEEAEFVNPFSGMIPDRQLTKEELIRAIRLDIAAEEEAVHLYNAQADATDDPGAAEILRDIAKEEVVHVGEFQKLLVQLNPEESDLLNKGAGEVVNKVGITGTFEGIRESSWKVYYKDLSSPRMKSVPMKKRFVADNKQDAMKQAEDLLNKEAPGGEWEVAKAELVESKINEFTEEQLDKVAQDMFGANYQDLPDYDHQQAVREELKFCSFKPSGRKYKEKDFYTEDAWKMIQAEKDKKESKKGMDSYVDRFLYMWQDSGELPKPFEEAIRTYWKNWNKSWLRAKLQFLSELEKRIPDFSDDIEDLKDDVIRYSRNPEQYKSQLKLEKRKMNIFEAKDMQVYKKLLQVLGDYTDKFPGTGVGRMFDQSLESGKKILPKDPLAVDILHYILKTNSVPGAVHKLLNLRFSGLPIELRPMIKNGRRKEVSHWTRGALISDRVKDMIDWSGSGKKGHWSTVDGEKVTLIDIKMEKD